MRFAKVLLSSLLRFSSVGMVGRSVSVLLKTAVSMATAVLGEIVWESGEAGLRSARVRVVPTATAVPIPMDTLSAVDDKWKIPFLAAKDAAPIPAAGSVLSIACQQRGLGWRSTCSNSSFIL